MILFYTSVIVTCFNFVLHLIYYNVLFKQVFFSPVEMKHEKLPPYFSKYSVNIGALLSLFISALIYGTFALSFNFFYNAPYSLPYILALMLWLFIASNELFIAFRSRSSVEQVVLHLYFWLIVFFIYSVAFTAARSF